MKLVRTIMLAASAALMISCACNNAAESYSPSPKDPDRGFNYVYPFTAAVQQTAAPAGYKPFYIGHFSRHGARYAYEDIYSRVDTTLGTAQALGVLTEEGKAFRASLKKLLPMASYRIGELTPKGWEQHKNIAGVVSDAYPEIFKHSPKISAVSSPVVRCVMSMNSYCLELGKRYPKADIFEEVSTIHYKATIPEDRHNPYKLDIDLDESPYTTELEGIDLSSVLNRFFTDTAWMDAVRKPDQFLWDVYTLAAGIASLDVEDELAGFFTDQEFHEMWEKENFHEYVTFYKRRFRYLPIAMDIVEKAQAAIEGGCKPSADLRFAHDSCFGPLIFLLNVNGYSNLVDTPEEVSSVFKTSAVRMACNLHFVLYKSKTNSDILFKLLLNCEEATLPLEAVDGPYYRWNDFVEYIENIKTEKGIN